MGDKKIHTETPDKAIARRVKIRVVGPEHRFAVIVPRELAQLCLREMKGIGIHDCETSDAGVEFTGRLTTAYMCNLWLRTASRVLCRLPAFRAGIAEELFYRTSEIPWDLWINPKIPLEIEAHVEYSRISHEGRAAELVFDGIQRSFGGGAAIVTADTENLNPGLKQRVLVHLVRNHCLISLDMTGAHLHERGYRLEHTGAPLRETLAAALLLKSEWDGGSPLVDGMCGSGTFTIEAAMIARNIPPGINRDFLFKRWPSFQKKTWEYLRQSAMKAEVDKSPAPILGIDVDPESIRIAGQNFGRAGTGGDIIWKGMDFFDFDPRAEKIKNGLVVLNPPYGRRLEGVGRAFYERLGEHLRRRYRGWRYAALSAKRADAATMKMPLMRIWSFRHGGIPIYAALGKIPP